MIEIDISRIQVRRGQEKVTGVPQLEPGEFGWAEDTENLYIGKRVAEGANSDENSRVLTSKDYDNVISIIESLDTNASASNYKYRAQAPYINADSLAISAKLDETVSLADFGVIPSAVPVDITAKLQTAVDTIFRNSTPDSFERADSTRRLLIPAGVYLITSAIDLPPNSTLVGAGIDTTIFLHQSDTASLFRTVDSDGNAYETNDMRAGSKRSKNVRLTDFTVQYITYSQLTTNAVISFDNTYQSSIARVKFVQPNMPGGQRVGRAIQIRGAIGAVGTDDVNLNEYVSVDSCVFEQYNYGVDIIGPVLQPVITGCVFRNLNRGVLCQKQSYTSGPSMLNISNSKFDLIAYEAVKTNVDCDNASSTNNHYVNVGNGLDTSNAIRLDGLGVAAYPVITFQSNYCRTSNDYFRRVLFMTGDYSTTVYGNAIVRGDIEWEDRTQYRANVIPLATSNVFKVPLTGTNQRLSLKYRIVSADIARAGELIASITPAGDGTVYDEYSYTMPTDIPVEFVITTNFSRNYAQIACVNTSVLMFIGTFSLESR